MNEPKENIEFLTIKEITHYAAEKYESVSQQVDLLKEQSHSCPAYCMIEKTLREHRLIPPKRSKSNVGSNISKESNSGVNKVSKEIAYFVVDKILFNKFANEKEIKAMQEKTEKQEKKRSEKLIEDSREMDRRLTEEQKEISSYIADTEAQEYNGKHTEDTLQAYPNLSKDHINGVHKSNFRYQLPKITWHPEYEGDTPGLPEGLIDQVVDRMMLRALFDVFYDFNETRFRRDFIERSKCILPDDRSYAEGYSELTQQLENPVGKYIFHKNKVTKGLRITVRPETEKRIQQYASEHNITVEKAIDDWIWSQPLKNDKEKK